MKIPILKEVSAFVNEIIPVYSDHTKHMNTFLAEMRSFFMLELLVSEDL